MNGSLLTREENTLLIYALKPYRDSPHVHQEWELQAVQEGAITFNQREAWILKQLDVPMDIIIKASGITALEAQQLFNLAELPIVEYIDPDKISQDERELKIKRDNYNHDQYVLKQGIEQSEAKGRHEEALEIACELKKEGLTIEFIAKTTKLSIEEIKAL